MRVEEQLKIIRRGVAEIISEEELLEKLRSAEECGRPLRVKLGVDPSAPDIHLGHTVVLRKLRQFQDLGHEVIFLIGDFTGRIGDPTGRSEARRQLTEEEVRENAATYAQQVFKVLIPEKTTIEFNSRWLAPLNFERVIELSSKYTVARMLEREDFAKRFQSENPVYIHEFFYPLMQAYDSVALKADVELGGTEQKFNILMARHIQREYGQAPEVAVLMPILVGTDGVQRMSKSLGNYIGINDSPSEMYGKTMSIPDRVMIDYYELVTDLEMAEIRRLKTGIADGTLHPRDVKARLAWEIVRMYHGAEKADAARDEFERVFVHAGLPDEIPEVYIDEHSGTTVRLPKLLAMMGLVSSGSEAKRLVLQGGVRVGDRRAVAPDEEIELVDGMVVRVGKRKVARVILAKK